MSGVSTATIIAGASLALTAAGTVASVIGASNRGQAQSQADYYSAQVAENNAIIAEQNAANAAAAGRAQAEQKSLQAADRLARVKTAQAASGIDVNSGSAVDVQAGTREIGALDAETVMSNAQITSYGYKSQANNERAKAQLFRMGGANAQNAGLLDAAGGLAGGVSSLGFKWLGLQGTDKGGKVSNTIPGTDTTYAEGLSQGIIPV